MIMQAADGQLVLSRLSDRKVLWTSNVTGHPGAALRFQQADGNLVVYDGTAELWQSGPIPNAQWAQLLDNCDFTVFVNDGGHFYAAWSLGTRCDDP